MKLIFGHRIILMAITILTLKDNVQSPLYTLREQVLNLNWLNIHTNINIIMKANYTQDLRNQ